MSEDLKEEVETTEEVVKVPEIDLTDFFKTDSLAKMKPDVKEAKDAPEETPEETPEEEEVEETEKEEEAEEEEKEEEDPLAILQAKVEVLTEALSSKEEGKVTEKEEEEAPAPLELTLEAINLTEEEFDEATTTKEGLSTLLLKYAQMGAKAAVAHMESALPTTISKTLTRDKELDQAFATQVSAWADKTDKKLGMTNRELIEGNPQFRETHQEYCNILYQQHPGWDRPKLLEEAKKKTISLMRIAPKTVKKKKAVPVNTATPSRGAMRQDSSKKKLTPTEQVEEILGVKFPKTEG